MNLSLKIKLLSILVLLLFCGLFLQKFTKASFSDTEKILGNSIEVGVWGTTPGVPTETPTPTPTPEGSPEETPTPTPTSTSTPTPTNTPTPTSTPTQTLPGIVINEVEYDTAQPGTDSDYEWFELYNNTSSPVILSGWTITDNVNSDVIPDLTLPANGFAVVAAKESGFKTNYPSFSGLVVYITDVVIGNGLANGGDRLILKSATNQEIDAVSWLSDDYAFGTGNGVSPATGAGHSIGRKINGVDTNSQLDWEKLINPTPGS